MALDVIDIAIAKKYTKETAAGGGAIKGDKGDKGERGEKGDKGDKGEAGQQGVQGVPGAKGDTGERGEKGDPFTYDDFTPEQLAALKGDKGEKGDTGQQGIQGIQGEKGEQGIQGIQGLQGVQGIKGDKGDDGYPFLIYKQYDTLAEYDAGDFPEIGLLFLVMEREEKGLPVYRHTGEGVGYTLITHMNTEGIKGERGERGEQGEQGVPGIQGEQGETGPQGLQGEQGEAGKDGKSAYEIAKEHGFAGTEEEWTALFNMLKNGGGGDKYLADDGTYKEVSGMPELAENGGLEIAENKLKVNEEEIIDIVGIYQKQDVYSTEEKIVGCDVDGRPIYKRTFIISNTVQSKYTDIVGDSNIREIFKYYGFLYGGDGVYSVGRWVTVRVINNNAQYYNYDISNSKKMTITLEYTKTTDAPGSYKPPAVTNTMNVTVGAIVPFIVDAIPDDFLPCDGKEYQIAQYRGLFRIIGNKFGGDGVNTFKVPDLRESALVGAGENTTNTIANHDVYEVGEFKDDQMQSHTHSVEGHVRMPAYNAGSSWTTYESGSKASGGATGRTGTTTHGKQTGVIYCIKCRADVINTTLDPDGGLVATDNGLALETPIVKDIHTVFAPAGITLQATNSYIRLIKQGRLCMVSAYRCLVTNTSQALITSIDFKGAGLPVPMATVKTSIFRASAHVGDFMMRSGIDNVAAQTRFLEVLTNAEIGFNIMYFCE